MASRPFDATVEIVRSRLSDAAIPINKEGGKAVAAFFREIYKELAAIDRAEATATSSRCHSAELKD